MEQLMYFDPFLSTSSAQANKYLGIMCCQVIKPGGFLYPFLYTYQFYATVRCRLRHYTKLPWREIKTKNGLQALTKAKQRKEASAKSVRPARPLQLFSQQGLYNARPPRLQPKMGCRPSKKQHNAKKQAASP